MRQVDYFGNNKRKKNLNEFYLKSIFFEKLFYLANIYLTTSFLKKYSLIFRGINFKIIYTSKTECSFHFIQPERNITIQNTTKQHEKEQREPGT